MNFNIIVDLNCREFFEDETSLIVKLRNSTHLLIKYSAWGCSQNEINMQDKNSFNLTNTYDLTDLSEAVMVYHQSLPYLELYVVILQILKERKTL